MSAQVISIFILFKCPMGSVVQETLGANTLAAIVVALDLLLLCVYNALYRTQQETVNRQDKQAGQTNVNIWLLYRCILERLHCCAILLKCMFDEVVKPFDNFFGFFTALRDLTKSTCENATSK